MIKKPRDTVDHYKNPSVANTFHEDRYGGTIGQWFMKTEQEAYANLASFIPPIGSVLDIGTGSGKLFTSIPSTHFVGLDTSLPMLKTARDIGGIRSLITANCTRLPVMTKSFDLVIGSRLLMHIPSWRHLIQECCRVAISGVILDFPIRPSFAALEPRIWSLSRRRDTHPKHRVFNRREVMASFSEYGFECAALSKGFVLPYRFHRSLNSLSASKLIEHVIRRTGITNLLGSPAYALFVPADRSFRL